MDGLRQGDELPSFFAQDCLRESYESLLKISDVDY